MKTYYCDGSQSRDHGLIGIGVTSEGVAKYVEIPLEDGDANMHETFAIKEAIFVALQYPYRPIIIVNDDINFVTKLKKALNNKQKKSHLKTKTRYSELITLLDYHKIKLRVPETVEDKQAIKKCHRLSRTYLNRFKG